MYTYRVSGGAWRSVQGIYIYRVYVGGGERGVLRCVGGGVWMGVS